MKTYKITFSYRGPKNFLRSSNLIIDADNEADARTEAMKSASAFSHACITKVTLYGEQCDLPLENTTGQKAPRR